MEAIATKTENARRSSYLESIFMVSSKDATVPAGKVYSVFQTRNSLFIFNKNGNKTLLDEKALRWKGLDDVVMVVKIAASRLDSLEPGKIYRVYNDAKNDERYVIDENGDRVLFDKNIFKWEVI